MADRVRLRGPSGQEWDCPAAAVDGWKDLGWKEAPTGSLSSKTKAELEQIAAERGVDISGTTTKADLVAALEG